MLTDNMQKRFPKRIPGVDIGPLASHNPGLPKLASRNSPSCTVQNRISVEIGHW